MIGGHDRRASLSAGLRLSTRHRVDPAARAGLEAANPRGMAGQG